MSKQIVKAMTNCWKWSEFAARFTEADYGLYILEKTLQTSILKFLVALVGCIVRRKKTEEIISWCMMIILQQILINATNQKKSIILLSIIVKM